MYVKNQGDRERLLQPRRARRFVRGATIIRAWAGAAAGARLDPPLTLTLILALGFAIACMPPSRSQSPSSTSTSTSTALASSEVAAGALVFAENCAVCHSLPILSSLWEQNRGRAPGFVYDAITRGNMRRMGAPLSDRERRAVAAFFTGVPFGSAAAQRDFAVSPACDEKARQFDWSDRAYPGWGGPLSNPRSITGDNSLGRKNVAQLKVSWVVAFPEASQLRSQPTAGGGALFVGSHNGSVYALDQVTGCTRWQFKADTEVRSAVTLDFEPSEEDAEGAPAVRAVFADRAANVYALDATTGALLWRQSVDPHLNAAVTGSVAAHEGRLYVPISSNDDINALDPGFPCCTHSGAVVALDASSGKILWRTPTVPEEATQTGVTSVGTPIWGPSGASVWNTPTISAERGLLFVGAGNNHSRPAIGHSDSVLALELETGRVAWTYQAEVGDAWNAACLFGNRVSCPAPEGPDTDFGATTMLVDVDGRDVLFAGQKSGVLHALDPETGGLLWKKRVAPGGAEGGIRYGMAAQGGAIFVPNADSASENEDGFSASPGLYAYSANEGAGLWSRTGKSLCGQGPECVGKVAAPPFATDELVFVAGLEGELAALDRASGQVLWQFETAVTHATLRGGTTEGGGIAGTAGPLIAGGRLFVSSGYGQAQRPGNALIALAAETP